MQTLTHEWVIGVCVVVGVGVWEQDVEDLEWLDANTKITHSTTGRPFSRDFVTRLPNPSFSNPQPEAVNLYITHRALCVCVCVYV